MHQVLVAMTQRGNEPPPDASGCVRVCCEGGDAHYVIAEPFVPESNKSHAVTLHSEIKIFAIIVLRLGCAGSLVVNRSVSVG